MRTALALILLASPAWATPPVAPPAKVAAKKPDAPKPEPKKAEPLQRHTETRKADAATSTLSLNTPAPKKKPRRSTLPDWAP